MKCATKLEKKGDGMDGNVDIQIQSTRFSSDYHGRHFRMVLTTMRREAGDLIGGASGTRQTVRATRVMGEVAEVRAAQMQHAARRTGGGASAVAAKRGHGGARCG